MTEVKTRLIMNLTKRQVICFGAAAAVGAPLFLVFKDVIGNTGAMCLMIAAVIPAFFFAIYNKDGVIPAEKFLLLVLRQKFFYPKIRVYRTTNMYALIENMAQRDKEGYFGKSEKPAGRHGRPASPRSGREGARKSSAGSKTSKGGTKGKPVCKTRRT